MKTTQGGEIHTIRFAYWTSMYDPASPCFILKKIAWIQTNQDFFFSCPPGNDIILFVYCNKGKGIVYNGEKTFMFSQGEALIFNIRDGYRAESRSEDFRFVWIQMAGNLPEAVLEHHLKDRGHIFPVGPEVLPICDQIFHISRKGWSYEGDIKISYLLYELMGTLLVSFPRDNTIELAVSYIQDHYMEPLTTAQLAKLCYLGTSQFIKRFKESFALTPKQYVNNYRVDKAKYLLMDTELPVSNVAASVGFEDSSYFTRVFKRIVGVTPHDFRKSLFNG